MPYSSTSDLPASTDKYSEKCRRAFLHAFNSVYDETHDEGRSMAAGHAAAQQCEGHKAMDEYNSKPIRFQIYTRSYDAASDVFLPEMLTAELGTDGKMRLHGIASSTVKDYHGDEILDTGLIDMETAANNNLTIFGNHSYDVPEDVYGSVEVARLQRGAATTKSGDLVHDLRMAIAINDENERAVKTWKAIKKGTKLGLSIGAMIPEGGARRDPKTGTLKIEHLELLETSIVGIPANPRSWVESAVKSFTEAEPQPVMPDVATWSTSTTNPTNTTLNTTNGNVSTLLDWHITPGPDTSGETTVDDVDPDITDAAKAPARCPDCGGSEGTRGCSNKFHKDADPDLEKVRVRVTVDTDDKDKTPAAPPSEPEPAPEADVTNSASETVAHAEEVVAGLDAEVTTAFTQLTGLVNQLTDQLIVAKRAEREAIAAKAAAEEQRDAIVAQAGEMIAKTKAVLEKLAGIPLGPRAAVDRDTASADLSNLEGLYSREFLDLLRS